MNDALPPRDHNQPPSSERAEALVANCNEWMTKSPEITDAEQAGRLQAFVDQIRLATADVEAEWKKEREPHDLAIIKLRTRYRPVLELLGIALDRAKSLAKSWLDRERMRLEQEAAERRQRAAEAEVAARLAREQAAKAGASVQAEAEARRIEDEAEAARNAALKPVERAAIRGEFSSKAMSLKSGWHAVIVNESVALKHFARHPSIRAAALVAVQKEATKQAKAFKDPTRAPPGVEFRNDEKAV